MYPGWPVNGDPLSLMMMMMMTGSKSKLKMGMKSTLIDDCPPFSLMAHHLSTPPIVHFFSCSWPRYLEFKISPPSSLPLSLSLAPLLLGCLIFARLTIVTSCPHEPWDTVFGFCSAKDDLVSFFPWWQVRNSGNLEPLHSVLALSILSSPPPPPLSCLAIQSFRRRGEKKSSTATMTAGTPTGHPLLQWHSIPIFFPPVALGKAVFLEKNEYDRLTNSPSLSLSFSLPWKLPLL